MSRVKHILTVDKNLTDEEFEERFLAKRAALQRLSDMEKTLGKELTLLQEMVKTSNNDITRRLYVRTVFSFIEGQIWLRKQFTLTMEDQGWFTLTAPERDFLSDHANKLQDNGQIKSDSAKIPLMSNLKFTLSMCSKCFGAEIDLQAERPNFASFDAANKVRDRITHPKTNDNLKITDEEMETVGSALAWFTSKMRQVTTTVAMRYERDRIEMLTEGAKFITEMVDHKRNFLKESEEQVTAYVAARKNEMPGVEEFLPDSL